MISQTRFSLLPYNTFHIQAYARRYFRIDEPADIDGIPALLSDDKDAFLVLGGGSNLLFVGDYEGTVLHINLTGINIEEDGDSVKVTARAGVEWDDLVGQCTARGLCGLENLSLIHGKVGAAPVQNIGAYGVEQCDCFLCVEVYDILEGKFLTLNADDCQFGYRDSIFKRPENRHLLITQVTYKLSRQGPLKYSYETLDAALRERGIRQPGPQDIRDAVIGVRRRRLPDPDLLGNAGSFFKNPVVSKDKYESLKALYADLVGFRMGDGSYKLAAGWLIDRAGWKGYRTGDAGVHDKQALVLVNHGNASGADILNLARSIREDIFNTFGVALDPEVNIIGDSLV
ncbi:MAG: UDP-N-acetylmuramate dehydrogenase [Lentimicrobiaceae bacterium]|nr:UDP-N-acetylmuramate dehydrogenase [Lentimicrobiaceae bacterium]